MKKLGFICALMWAFSPAHAFDGNQANEWCNDGSHEHITYCLGMIYGATNMLATLQYQHACIPQNWTNGQILGVYRQFLADNPQLWHEPALGLLVRSLAKAFPCPTPEHQL